MHGCPCRGGCSRRPATIRSGWRPSQVSASRPARSSPRHRGHCRVGTVEQPRRTNVVTVSGNGEAMDQQPRQRQRDGHQQPSTQPDGQEAHMFNVPSSQLAGRPKLPARAVATLLQHSGSLMQVQAARRPPRVRVSVPPLQPPRHVPSPSPRYPKPGALITASATRTHAAPALADPRWPGTVWTFASSGSAGRGRVPPVSLTRCRIAAEAPVELGGGKGGRVAPAPVVAGPEPAFRPRRWR
jgi:hypothetical protein